MSRSQAEGDFARTPIFLREQVHPPIAELATVCPYAYFKSVRQLLAFAAGTDLIKLPWRARSKLCTKKLEDDREGLGDPKWVCLWLGVGGGASVMRRLFFVGLPTIFCCASFSWRFSLLDQLESILDCPQHSEPFDITNFAKLTSHGQHSLIITSKITSPYWGLFVLCVL